MRIGYAPYSPSLTAPGDRRRFGFYARRRGLEFELADPSRTYDLVVLSERADITAWSRYRPGKAKVIYDLIDSYLALPPGPKQAGRGLAKFLARETRRPVASYRRAIEAMCRRADAVICTTREQRADIEPLCRNVHEILDSQSHLVTRLKDSYGPSDPFRLCWEGLPYTLNAFESISDPLRQFSRSRPTEMHLVTDISFKRWVGRFGTARTASIAAGLFERPVVHQWTEDSLAPTLTACDLALIPLDLHDPFARGKPENKLLLFWRLGIPALVSTTPSYVRAMRGAGVDMACETEADWLAAVASLADDEQARHEAGERGRNWAEENHGDARLLARWDAALDSVAS